MRNLLKRRQILHDFLKNSLLNTKTTISHHFIDNNTTEAYLFKDKLVIFLIPN